MVDPVFTMDGVTYERSAIEAWLQTHDTSPATGRRLPAKRVVENVLARGMARELIDRERSATEATAAVATTPAAVPKTEVTAAADGAATDDAAATGALKPAKSLAPRWPAGRGTAVDPQHR